jgi:hypothetical protein
LRAGPCKITKLVNSGNAVYLEGFRHPFNVALFTPTLTWANGAQTHLSQLTQHSIIDSLGMEEQLHDPKDLSHEEGLAASSQHVEIAQVYQDIYNANTAQQPVNILDGVNESAQANQSTHIANKAQQPVAVLDGVDNSMTEHIMDIPNDVIIPAQLPSDIVKIVHKTGCTRNSAVLTCLMSNGDKCRIRQRHLKSVIGDIALNNLLHQYITSAS